MSLRIIKSSCLLGIVMALAACTSVPLDQAGTSDGSGHQGAGVTTGTVMDPFNPQSPLARDRSVYFEFDSYTVPEQYRRVVEMHASWLGTHTDHNVRIEGNADARGGSEYNLALGQRRSDAVARMMMLLGVNAAQIEAISFGKERPRALGHTEADYAENRRADVVYQR